MTSNKVPTIWIAHLKDKEKADFEQAIRTWSNTPVADRFIEILKAQVRELDRQETTLLDYESASWSHKQAHRNGARQSFLTILKLLGH